MGKKGKCIICSIEGRGNKDFICDKCFERTKKRAKEGPIFFCRGCGKLGPVTEEILRVLQKFSTSLPLDNRPGVIIIIEACKNCFSDEKKLTEYQIYTIRGLPILH